MKSRPVGHLKNTRVSSTYWSKDRVFCIRTSCVSDTSSHAARVSFQTLWSRKFISICQRFNFIIMLEATFGFLFSFCIRLEPLAVLIVLVLRCCFERILYTFGCVRNYFTALCVFIGMAVSYCESLFYFLRPLLFLVL